MKLSWKVSSSTSALNAAHCLVRGLPLIDPRIAQSLAEPAEQLNQIARSVQATPERFWDWLLGLSSEIDGNLPLAERVLIKTAAIENRPGTLVTRLSSAISHVETAFGLLFPKGTEQLILRGRPLQEMWEARGPGLLAQIGEWTDPTLLVQQAEVVQIQPVLGGGGAAFALGNRIRIEAVLTNPHADLPEVLRLGWLLAQLESDLPIHGELVSAGRLPWIASLAMLPVTLRAGEELELCKFNEASLQHALACWYPPSSTTPEVLPLLLSWWDTYQAQRPKWRVALTALDKML